MATTSTRKKRRRSDDEYAVDRAIEPPGGQGLDYDEEPIEPFDPGWPPPRLRTARDVYRWLPDIPGWSIAALNGRLIMSPAGDRRHARGLKRWVMAFGELGDKRGWDIFAGSIDVCFFPSRETYIPDLVIAQLDCPLWGDDLHSDGVLLVGEIVSKGSVAADREEKPRACAASGVPLMLLIDPIANPARVTLMSEPGGGLYQRAQSVPLGQAIHLPDPVDFELDTSIFLEQP